MKKRRHAFLLTLAFLTPLIALAAPMQMMRFHCGKDTTEINTLLKKGFDSGERDPNALVSLYARQLLGTPYVAHTLEGDTEMLTINIHQLDCTTFVETLYALTRTTLERRYSWRDYASNLENLRYRRGHIDGYASRLHYISDWVMDNKSRGNIEEVTADLPGSKTMVKTIDFMTRHRDKYLALSDSATWAKIRNYEIGFRSHKYAYVRKSLMNNKEVKKALLEGDIVGLVTKIDGLDVSHMGIVVKDEKGELFLLDASSADGKVQIEKENMMRYLEKNKNYIGVRVFRIRKN